jgi:SnoaL-like domain
MRMTTSQEPMTDEQRKSLALTYLEAFDNAGVTATGGSILDLFADDARVYFPKWGVATGKDEIGRMFGDVGATITSILHDYADFNWVMTGTDTFACEGTSAGEHRDGPWRAGASHAGRWADVFEVRDHLIQRCFIYLDPDYAGKDTDRYPWLGAGGRDPSKPMP